MLDEDDTVKDLAVKTVEELWFQNSSPQVLSHKARSLSSSTQNPDKAPLLSKVTVIMGVSASFKDRQSPLEDLLHKIISSQNSNELSFMRTRYSEMCEALIDGLVDASDLPGFVSKMPGLLTRHSPFFRLSCLASGHYISLHQLTLLSCPVAMPQRYYLTSRTQSRCVISFHNPNFIIHGSLRRRNSSFQTIF